MRRSVFNTDASLLEKRLAIRSGAVCISSTQRAFYRRGQLVDNTCTGQCDRFESVGLACDANSNTANISTISGMMYSVQIVQRFQMVFEAQVVSVYDVVALEQVDAEIYGSFY